MARILIVDDNFGVRELLTVVLTGAGHTVMGAAGGHEALTLVKNARPDLLITDLLMPEGDGIELLRVLREEKADLRIIAMSGGGRLGSETYLRIARAFQPDRLLMKPFEPDALLAAVDAVLHRAPAGGPS